MNYSDAPFVLSRPDGARIGSARLLMVSEKHVFISDPDHVARAAFQPWTPGDLVVRDNVAGRWLLARGAKLTFAVDVPGFAPRFQFTGAVEELDAAPWEAVRK